MRAGERAAAIFANDEAIVSYRAALDQLGALNSSDSAIAVLGDARVAELHERLGDVLELTGRLADAQRSFGDALGHCDKE